MAGRYTGKKCRLLTMFGLTSFFFLVEIIVGYVTNSMALVADSFHMLSDIAALVIAFISVKMAPKSWDKNTYGWARAEVLGALVNAVFLGESMEAEGGGLGHHQAVSRRADRSTFSKRNEAEGYY